MHISYGGDDVTIDAYVTHSHNVRTSPGMSSLSLVSQAVVGVKDSRPVDLISSNMQSDTLDASQSVARQLML